MKCDNCFHKEICTDFINMKDGTYGYTRHNFDPDQCGAYVNAEDIAPLVHGYNNNSQYSEYDEFRCSACGVHLEDWNLYDEEDNMSELCFNFCPNCGARMDGDKNE